MASRPPTKDARDKNLSDLEKAVSKWGEVVQTRLENEVSFMRSVLEGRTGSKKAGTVTLDSASKLLQEEIDNFITFGPEEDRE